MANAFWPLYEVVGVPDPDQLQQDIASQGPSMFNVPIRPQITVERIDEKLVVTVFVAEALAHEKPIHFKTQPLPHSARRRIGSTDQRCTEDDLIVFYHERRGASFDEQIIDDATLNDIDDEAIEVYPHPRNSTSAFGHFGRFAESVFIAGWRNSR